MVRLLHWCNGDLVKNMTDSTTPDEIASDTKFRENVRRQLLEKGAEGTTDPKDTYVPMVDMDPSEGRAVRWFGSVIGAGLLLIGAFWFLGILGYSFPWYTIFPVMAMFVGAFFLAAAYATRGNHEKRGR